MTPTLIALTGFIVWTIILLVWMGVIRIRLVMTKVVRANEFRPDNANLSPFMQRLARAHANCLEGLPIFGGLMLIAQVSGRAAVTDPLAYTLLAARILQSLAHVSSPRSRAVLVRFAGFVIQLGIAVWWAIQLLTGPTA